MPKNNHNYNVSREKYSNHALVCNMKEENSPIKTYAASGSK